MRCMVAELRKALSQYAHAFLEPGLLLLELANFRRRGRLLDHPCVTFLRTVLTESLCLAFNHDHPRNPERELHEILDLGSFN
jgi:hypothetical protein